jgi:hypothetical protein
MLKDNQYNHLNLWQKKRQSILKIKSALISLIRKIRAQ